MTLCQYWPQALSDLSEIYKNMHITMLSIVSFMKTEAGKAAILLTGGIGNHVHMCTVKPHDVLKKKKEHFCAVLVQCH